MGLSVNKEQKLIYLRIWGDWRFWIRKLPSYGEEHYGEKLRWDGVQFEIGYRRY